MNAPQRQNRSDGDTAVAEPRPDADGTPEEVAAADAPAVDGMDRDDWLCRVGDVARLLRQQRRAAEGEGQQPAEDRN